MLIRLDITRRQVATGSAKPAGVEPVPEATVLQDDREMTSWRALSSNVLQPHRVPRQAKLTPFVGQG
jgi:hypothetical protein